MKNPTTLASCFAGGMLTMLLLTASGCGKAASKTTPTATPPQPQEAASQIQQAFVSASPEIKTTATAASQALQTANYEQAIQSLQAIKARQNLTVEQGMAVYNSERSLEATLINRMMAGDANAKRAYEQLKKSRRN